jgi:hypothetical protein
VLSHEPDFESDVLGLSERRTLGGPATATPLGD